LIDWETIVNIRGTTPIGNVVGDWRGGGTLAIVALPNGNIQVLICLPFDLNKKECIRVANWQYNDNRLNSNE
jgi:hypothetical protein